MVIFGCAFWYAGRKSWKKIAFRPALSAQWSVTGSVGSFAPVLGKLSWAPAVGVAGAAVVGAGAGGAALVGAGAAGAALVGAGAVAGGAAGALVHAASAAVAAAAPLAITNCRRERPREG